MADEMRGVPIGDLPGIESVPDDSLLVVEFLGKAYNMPGSVLKQLFQDILDAMGTSVDDVTEARLTAAIKTVLAEGKHNGVSPIVEVLDEEDGTSVIHVIDAFGVKKYPVEVKGARNAVQYVEQELTDAQKKQARKNINAFSRDHIELNPYVAYATSTSSGEKILVASGFGVTLYTEDGNKFSARAVAIDPYQKARSFGFQGGEGSFYHLLAHIADGLEIDPKTNELYLTSDGSRLPMMGVVLPSGGDGTGGGVTAPVNGFFTLSVDEDGNLWAHSAESGTTPDFEYDSETGNLYFVTEQE